MAQDQETIQIKGQAYTAIDAPIAGRCGDCAFKNGFGCLLAEATESALAYCSGKHRADGKDKNFVLAHRARPGNDDSRQAAR